MFGLDFVKKAQEMQTEMQELQKELEYKIVHGFSGAYESSPIVSIEMSGKQEVKSVKVNEAALKTLSARDLENHIYSATNQALAKSREMMASEMSKITGGLKIPGLF